jgi:hypothetical protein
MVTERERMRFGFETEGVTLESRLPRGYEEGSFAWVVDEPRFGLPDGSSFDCRVTAVVRKEEAVWRIVHALSRSEFPTKKLWACSRSGQPRKTRLVVGRTLFVSLAASQ